ncbi:hypothetical protein K438DRAFT_1755427 [Mycena galopus ATCC 62051]|nr:hypothetical protein K438DRAFT_1755427 [Mycena galopus ATCC 62051]
MAAFGAVLCSHVPARLRTVTRVVHHVRVRLLIHAWSSGNGTNKGQTASGHFRILLVQQLRAYLLEAVSIDWARNNKLSSDWVLKNGIKTAHSVASKVLSVPGIETGFSVHMNLSIATRLPYDAVLGRDWIQYCQETVPNGDLSLLSGIIDLRHSPLSTSEKTLISCAVEQSAFLDQNTPYDPSVIGRRIHDDSSSSLWHRRPNPGAEESTFKAAPEVYMHSSTAYPENLSAHLPVQHAQGFNGISDPGSASALERAPYVQLSLEDKKRVFDRLIGSSVAVLRPEMVCRHEKMSRTWGQKDKDAATLGADFLSHQCSKLSFFPHHHAITCIDGSFFHRCATEMFIDCIPPAKNDNDLRCDVEASVTEVSPTESPKSGCVETRGSVFSAGTVLVTSAAHTWMGLAFLRPLGCPRRRQHRKGASKRTKRLPPS